MKVLRRCGCVGDVREMKRAIVVLSMVPLCCVMTVINVLLTPVIAALSGTRMVIVTISVVTCVASVMKVIRGGHVARVGQCTSL